jgi:mannose-1-phosphate guanylyltransferase
VPKQFCSLHGGRTLVEDAVARAAALTVPERICAIVAEQHRQWWRDVLAPLPRENVIAQPRNRGTAIGVLYPLLHILARDPQANVVLLPSDHYVREEFVLRQSLRAALRRLEREPATPVLLGLAPEEADSELGYILPGSKDADGSALVTQFIEKPSPQVARDIIANGGLWNAFIIAANVRSLVQIFTDRYPELVMDLQAAIEHGRRTPDSTALIETYQRLPELDFSRHILEGRTHALRVVRVPQCGWSDLGTPKRVAETLRRLRFERNRDTFVVRDTPHVNLALQHARMERAARAERVEYSVSA